MESFRDLFVILGFKPYYKWNTFNTVGGISQELIQGLGFKPYYKWNTFNTMSYGLGRMCYL